MCRGACDTALLLRGAEGSNGCKPFVPAAGAFPKKLDKILVKAAAMTRAFFVVRDGKAHGAAACGCTMCVRSGRLFGATPQCAWNGGWC